MYDSESHSEQSCQPRVLKCDILTLHFTNGLRSSLEFHVHGLYLKGGRSQDYGKFRSVYQVSATVTIPGR